MGRNLGQLLHTKTQSNLIGNIQCVDVSNLGSIVAHICFVREFFVYIFWYFLHEVDYKRKKRTNRIICNHQLKVNLIIVIASQVIVHSFSLTWIFP